jgi:hypothetical protein
VDSLRFDLSDKSSVAVGGSKLVFNFPDNNRKRRGGYNTFEDVVCSWGDSGWCFSGPNQWDAVPKVERGQRTGTDERAGSCARPGSVPWSIDPLSTISPNKTYYSYCEIRNYISGGPTHWTHLLKFDQQSPATLVAVDTWMDDHCPRDETLYLQLKTRKKRREKTNHSVSNPCDDFERKSICRWSLWFIFAGRFSIPLLFLEMNPASIYQQLTTTSSAKIIIVASIWRVHLAETLV